MKKLNNNGFSLVELIIVIAIMAALVGIISPQYLKYVESSRVAADDAVIEQIKSAAKVAMTEEGVIGGGVVTFAVKAADKIVASPTGSKVEEEMRKILADFDSIRLKSKLYSGGVTITVNTSTAPYAVTHANTTATPPAGS